MRVLFNRVYFKMHLSYLLVSALLLIADGFTVKGPSGPLVVPLGGSVLLPCSVDSLLSLKDLDVQWKRSDSQTLIHLYQDGDIRPEVQLEDYHDRAHFFTEHIKQGNFSLLLKNVTAEDEGQYTCTVHRGTESNETVMDIIVERLIVSGSDDLISMYVGEEVTLNCSVNSHIPPEDIEEVSWKKTDKDEHITVLLYQSNEVHPESSDEQYRDRVEFFSDEIHRGNFSLRLKRVRTEDKGEYMCQVFAGRFSDNTTIVLPQIGWSSLHIMVLILCIIACGSALLFFSLIYGTNNKGFRVENFYFVSKGNAMVLPCFLYPQSQTEGLKIKWRRSGLKSPVCVYENGSEVQHKDYHDRAHFFKDIQYGNLSLLLKNVTIEDEGEYTCTVNSKQRPVFSFSLNLKCIDDLSDSKFIVVYSCDVVVSLGSSVVLPCLTKKDQPLPAEGLKVEWKKLGSESPVFVYEDGEVVQNEDYRDRAHFYTEDLKHENFSLLLKNLRKEDEGNYTCKVYSGTVFSRFFHSNLVERLQDSGFRLQMFLAICPNITMCVAFVLWGFSEGSVSETVCCCILYFLRPLLLLWTAPYINDFKDRNKTLILKYSYVADYFVLTAVVYPALFATTWQKIQNFSEFERVLVIILYGIMFVCCSCKGFYILAAEFGNRSIKVVKIFDIVADFTFESLPTLQFILLFYTFGSARGGIIIIAVLPLLLTMTNERMFRKCYLHFGWSNEFIATVMLIVTLGMNAVMIGFFIFTMENKTGFHRFVSLYVLGSVIVVLICAVALMAELILKTINGERAVMDLRFIVFPSESLFIMSVLISGQFSSRIQSCLKSCQMRMTSQQTSANTSQQNPNQDSSSLLQMSTLEQPSEPIHQDEGGTPPFAEKPGVPWCTCGNCREMPTDPEKKCCGKEPANCLSLLPDFSRYCLDEVFIHSQDMTELGNIREPGDKNKENRYGAYKNYIYWQHGSLGQGNRLVIPSCCVWRIREKFPDPQQQFTCFVPVM